MKLNRNQIEKFKDLEHSTKNERMKSSINKKIDVLKNNKKVEK